MSKLKNGKLLLPAVPALLLPFPLLRCGLVAGCTALHGCEQAESGCHIFGGTVLVVGLVRCTTFLSFRCAGMSRLLCRKVLFGNLLLYGVRSVLPGEKVVEHTC